MAGVDAEIRIKAIADSTDLKKIEERIDIIKKKLDALKEVGAEGTPLYAQTVKELAEWEDKLKSIGATTKEIGKIENMQMPNDIAEAERLKAIRVSAIVSDQKIVSLANEKVQIEKRLVELKKAGVGIGYKEYDEKAKRLAEINAELSDYTNGFKKAEESAKKCLKSVENGTKKSNKALGSTMKVLRNIVLSMVAFQVMAKGAEYIASGFKNLVQYSSELNGTFSELKSQTVTLKNSMATAFAPIVAEIIPHLTSLIGWLNTAMNAMSQFWAVLSGKSTYTRAKKQVLDYAASIKDATKAAKGALATFDDLNVLNKKDSGNVSGEMTGADAFEEVAIDAGFVAALEKVKTILEIIAPLALFIGGAFLTWKVTDFLASIMKISPILGDVAAWLVVIAGVALSIWSYMGMWKDGVDWEGLIGYVAGVSLVVGALYMLFGPLVAGIALITAGIAGVVLALKDIIENGVTTENITLLLISAFGILTGIFMAFGAKAAIVAGIVMGVIGVLALLVAYGGNGEEALNHLKDTFKSLGDFVSKVFTGDIEGAFESLKNAGRSLGNFFICVAEGIANAFINMVNAVIDAINSLTFDVPDFLQSFVGADKIGPIFNIPHWSKLKLPRLATGGIVTASTLANIGEAGREAVLPLDNNTEWMDKLAERINSRGGETRVIVELDGKVVYNNVVKHDREHIKRTGSSSFAY